MDPEGAAALFPDGSFSADPRWDRFSREIYEYRLAVAEESSLWAGEPVDERYRFLASESFPGVIRVEIKADGAEVLAKRVNLEVNGDRASAVWSVQKFRRPLAADEVQRLRALIDKAGFWELPSSIDPAGLDGYHALFEARVGERYHLVDRWCPNRDAFAELCAFCEALFYATTGEKKS